MTAMQEPKIKICGLRRLEDAQAVNAVRVQYAGFVFAPSKRQVTAQQAQQLREALLPTVQTVGVFVDAPPEEIVALCQQGIIHIIQLHGHEDAAYLETLRSLTDAPIIKAVAVRSGQDILQAQQLHCDYLLLDTFIPGVAGGSGKQFDYQQIPPLYKPFFLAGGLTPENVGQAIAQVHPYAVDVSSGVEANGWKSAEKIQRFVRQVRKQA
jgi:phosphoribosylanthranilate isomerase